MYQSSFLYLEIAVVLLNGIGQMALVAVLYGMLKRGRAQPLLHSVVLGAALGMCGVVDMILPIQAVPGVFVDFRAVAVGLAGAFAGWPGAIIAGTATGLYRLELGGAGAASGCTGILIAASAGLLWRGIVSEAQRTSSRSLLLLGVLVSCHALVFFNGILPGSVAALICALQVAAALLGALAFGKLIERETTHFARERELASDASSDPLTGLPNRRSFHREVLRARSSQPKAALALLMIDVDHFKSVNDRHGHAVGDDVLRRLAVLLRQNLRDGDRVARHGGEEFTLLLPNTTEGEAMHVAERLRKRIADDIIALDGIHLRITVSIGIGVCTGASSFDRLLQDADKALYSAKANGRNRTECTPGCLDPGAMPPVANLAEGRLRRRGEVVGRSHFMEA